MAPPPTFKGSCSGTDTQQAAQDASSFSFAPAFGQPSHQSRDMERLSEEPRKSKGLFGCCVRDNGKKTAWGDGQMQPQPPQRMNGKANDAMCGAMPGVPGFIERDSQAQTEWTYVGNGKGKYEPVESYNFVGLGQGSYSREEAMAAPIAAIRPGKYCYLALALLALVTVAYFVYQWSSACVGCNDNLTVASSTAWPSTEFLATLATTPYPATVTSTTTVGLITSLILVPVPVPADSVGAVPLATAGTAGIPHIMLPYGPGVNPLGVNPPASSQGEVHGRWGVADA